MGSMLEVGKGYEPTEGGIPTDRPQETHSFSAPTHFEMTYICSSQTLQKIVYCNKNTLPWLFSLRKKLTPKKRSLSSLFLRQRWTNPTQANLSKKKVLNCHFLPKDGVFFFLLPKKINQFRFNNFQFSGCRTVTFFSRMGCFSSRPPPYPSQKKNAQNLLRSAWKKVGTSSTSRLVVRWHTSPRGQGFTEPRCRVTSRVDRVTRGKSEMVTRDLGGGKFGNKWCQFLWKKGVGN